LYIFLKRGVQTNKKNEKNVSLFLSLSIFLARARAE